MARPAAQGHDHSLTVSVRRNGQTSSRARANSALSAVYYLRLVRTVYIDAEKGASTRPVPVGTAVWTALGVGVISILPLAAFANGFVTSAQQAAGTLLGR